MGGMQKNMPRAHDKALLNMPIAVYTSEHNKIICIMINQYQCQP